jgi:hypothetical protein
MDNEFLLIQKKATDMIVYNNIMLKQFPKHEKYLLANKIRELGYQVLEDIITVSKKYFKKTTFSDMDVKHEVLRQLVNLSFKLKYIDAQKHKEASLRIDELGRMIGGWIKKQKV